MKLVFFGNDVDKIAAIRYRIGSFARRLEAEGHTCVICLPASTETKDRLYEGRSKLSKLVYLFWVLLRRLAQLRHVPGADAVFFRGPVYPYGPPLLERVMRWMNPRLIFDIDDAIWEPPAHVSSPFLRWVDFGWVRKMSGMCAHAVVGNEYLAEHVASLNPDLPVTIVPTCIDMDLHQPKHYGAGNQEPVVLGWTGLKDNLGYMEIIEPVLRDLAARYPIRIEVASGAAYALDGVEVVNHRWEKAHEIDYLRNVDVGLMPLKETPRAKGKCAFKALQYMGCAVPAVISPVGMNRRVVEDGVHGFIAEGAGEWRDKLERLITDPELRRAMGQAAREHVAAHYSHDAHYPHFKAALESAAAGRRSIQA